MSLNERFWLQIDRKGDEECWNWLGGGDRYGYIDVNRRTMMAHHAALLIVDGVDVPSGIVVCHSCDNVKCVNPSHLFFGTQLDNMRDMVAKGRHSLMSHNSKLTIDDVREIRRLGESKVPHAEIAKKFNINASGITRIVNYHTYANVDPENFQQSYRVKTRERKRKRVWG